ncbi:hypothetical protein P167DRAFT_550603 [Morchella conica CCBAS932]|uniref:Uncharacterized protein n=1 Tax=Morchella conica CCBAS932 TaxID=1392247 RepID=A0A3N4KAF6_9PEZI|nr:hypothetical protein P167DRAFT_550603 [Morchella conica CCBAS932]
MNIVLNEGTVKRGRPPTHGVYSGKRKRKPEASALVYPYRSEASYCPKQVAARVADEHQEPKSSEQVQSEQHAVVALTEPAPVIVAKNVAKKLPALPKQALEYTMLVNGVKVTYPFSPTYKEFGHDEKKYKNLLSRVRGAMGTRPTMWIHTDKEYNSGDEEYYTVPDPTSKKGKGKEPVTSTQASKRQVPPRKVSVVATENILKTSRYSRLSSVWELNVETRTVDNAKKTGSKKNEESIASSSKKTSTQETHSSTQQVANVEWERTLSAQPEPHVERKTTPPSAQLGPAVQGDMGPPPIPIQPPSKSTPSHGPFTQAFMQTQDFAKEYGFEMEKLFKFGLEDVFTTPPSTLFMPGTQNGSVRKKAHIGRMSAQRSGGRPPALGLELAHDYPSLPDSRPYAFHKYQKKTRQPPKMLIPGPDPESQILIQDTTQVMGTPPLPANQRGFRTALQYGRQSMELPLNGLMGHVPAMGTYNSRMLGNMKIPGHPELIGHPRPSGMDILTHAAAIQERLPVPENNRQAGVQLEGQTTNIVTR